MTTTFGISGPYGADVKGDPPTETVTLEWLEENQPWIQWREPILMQNLGGSGLGCRICIAQKGIAGHNIKYLPQSESEHDDHLAACHGITRHGG